MQTLTIAGVRGRTWSATLVGMLMYASSACAASGNLVTRPATSLCFEHIGPQDKPMPAFCINAPGAATSVAHSHQVAPISPAPAQWQALREQLAQDGQKVLARPATFGGYQVRSSPSGKVVYLPPQAMRKMLRVLEGSERLSQPQLENLQRLRLRLGVPIK